MKKRITITEVSLSGEMKKAGLQTLVWMDRMFL